MFFLGCSVELKCSCNDQYLQIYVNKVTKQDSGSSTLAKHASTDCKCGEQTDKMKSCAWYHNRAKMNSDSGLARTNADSLTLASENGVVNTSSTPSEASLQELTEKTKISSVDNIFPKSDNKTLELQELCERFGNKNLCASKSDLIATSQIQIAADRRKVARMNDETYLQCYRTAISLAVQASESTNHDGGKTDILFYCSKMSLIPMLVTADGKSQSEAISNRVSQKMTTVYVSQLFLGFSLEFWE